MLFFYNRINTLSLHIPLLIQMSVYLIDREYIPENYYLCKPDNKNDWKHIHQIVFDNGFEYYVGSNYLIQDITDILTNLETDYKTVKENKTPSDLQSYYMENYQVFTQYVNCENIWKYYTENSKLIEEILNSQ
jgi:hypothetical protein